MNRFTVRGRAFAALTLFSLSASTMLTGCFDKEDDANPDGSVCSIAATVVEKAGTGLVLQLTNGTYVVPTGSNWTNFQAKAGDAVTVGYATGKGKCGKNSSTASGQTVELGCITAVATNPTTGTTTTGAN